MIMREVVTKFPPKDERAGNQVTACTCSPLFAAIFLEVVILIDELWDIFCIYPRDNYSRDNFFIPHLNNNILSLC